MTREVHVVVPAGIDDLASPSGGNRYDRRVVQGLAATGWDVRERAVPGGWPRPDATARAGLATALAAVPDGAVVLVDGLVACGVPDVVVPAARRLALVVLVHLPLGDETGAPPELAVREREVLAAAAAVIATSPWAAHRVVARHGLDPARVTVATPGVDPAPLAPGSGGTGLLCVGALTPTKGQDLLVAALAEVRDLPWTATLVGPLRDPGHVDAVRAAIERHGLAGRVRTDRPADRRGPRRGLRGHGPAGGAVARGDLRDGRHRGAGPGYPGPRERRGRAAGDARPRPGGPRAGDGRPGRSRCGPRCRAARLDGRPGPAGGAPALGRNGVGACCTDGR